MRLFSLGARKSSALARPTTCISWFVVRTRLTIRCWWSCCGTSLNTKSHANSSRWVNISFLHSEESHADKYNCLLSSATCMSWWVWQFTIRAQMLMTCWWSSLAFWQISSSQIFPMLMYGPFTYISQHMRCLCCWLIRLICWIEYFHSWLFKMALSSFASSTWCLGLQRLV